MSEFIGESGLLSISSNPHDVEQLLTSLEDLLVKSRLDEMSAFHLRCAVVEVVNNCIQHAYLNKTGQPIRVAYQLGDDRVQIAVSDKGRAFLEPEETSDMVPMSESGRGLQIIRAWVTKLRFERRDEWNVCELEQRIPP
jgi:anti-sigma regulatory factor (Ser/Thr protein kinase)